VIGLAGPLLETTNRSDTMPKRAPNPECKVCHGLNVDVMTRTRAACDSCWPKAEKPAEKSVEVPEKPAKKAATK